MTGPLGSNLRTVGDLGDRDVFYARTVTLPDGMSGQLVATFERKDETALVLMVGGARVFTAFLANETEVEVHLQSRGVAR